MMGWDSTLALERLLKEKDIVRRERTPIWVMVYAVYLYVVGASLQRAAEAVEAFCLVKGLPPEVLVVNMLSWA
ncbi:MAG: hypothetical protein ACE5IB_04830 [Candidatus Geothermarchaeales archaeon]